VTSPAEVPDAVKDKIAELRQMLENPYLPAMAKKSIEQEIQKLTTSTVKIRLEDMSEEHLAKDLIKAEAALKKANATIAESCAKNESPTRQMVGSVTRFQSMVDKIKIIQATRASSKQ
jgi:hypothetical protein